MSFIYKKNLELLDIAASLVKLVTKTAADPSADLLRRPRLESVVTRPNEATAHRGGSLVRHSKEAGAGERLAEVLEAAVASEVDRLRTAVGPPTGCPIRKK